jgi:hypothetical protein
MLYTNLTAATAIAIWGLATWDAGITINLSRLFDQQGFKKTGKILEYIQIPYTVPKVSHTLD